MNTSGDQRTKTGTYNGRRWILLLVLTGIAGGWLYAEEAIDPEMRDVHDPTMIRAGSYYYVYSTGGPIQMRRSSDLCNWQYLGRVLPAIPQWVKDKIRDGSEVVTDLWAPDIIYHNGKYYLNYSASLWGRNISTIALLSNTTLNPSNPNYQWIDEGEIISSADDPAGNYNTIDGTFVRDAGGNMWLSFGSYWSGIKLTPLNNTTLKPTTTPPTLYSIASRPSTSIEASYITYHNGYYYLFVNFDQCCDGVNSTYKIMVGRSSTITGPYLDKNGVSMLSGGGTLFVTGTSRWKGPGHATITTVDGQDYFSFHTYDALYNGVPTLRVHYLSWDQDLWPVLGYPVLQSPPAGTIAHWNFEDGTPGAPMNQTGTTQQVGTVDVSGNGFDMFAWDQTYGPSFSLEGQTPSGSGLSARCSGGQDGYTVESYINNWTPTDWTIEVAVKLDTLSGWQTFIGRDGSSHGEVEADFYFQKDNIDNTFRLSIETVGGQRYVVDSNFVVVPGQWYYLAAVSDGSVLKIYADKLDGSGSQVVGTLNLNPNNDNALAAKSYVWTFGRGWFNGAFVDQITGNLDDIRFTDRALSPSEFLHYQCGAWGYLQHDLNTDCTVNLEDFAPFASVWTGSLESFIPFAEEWLATTLPYADGAIHVGP
jgi:arabinan endo-1,5-alpha-L-arabinosidase